MISKSVNRLFKLLIFCNILFLSTFKNIFLTNSTFKVNISRKPFNAGYDFHTSSTFFLLIFTAFSSKFQCCFFFMLFDKVARELFEATLPFARYTLYIVVYIYTSFICSSIQCFLSSKGIIAVSKG